LQPTEEQQRAIDLAKSGKSFVLDAKAGAGKSSTLRMIAKVMPSGSRGLLTAFSAQVIADARKASFPSTVRITSNHGLAVPAFGKHYFDAGRLKRRLTPRVIVEALGLRDAQFPGDVTAEQGAHLALEAVLRFQQGAERSLLPKHVILPGSVDDTDDLGGAVFKLANRLWAAMSDLRGNLPATHDTYLKLWALSEPRIRADYVLLDEAQDANALIVDVLNAQDAQLIVVGDPNQQIFSWRGAVSAMGRFATESRALLSQSFRFGNMVAQAANAVLAGHLGQGERVRGFDQVRDRIGSFDRRQRYTVIARTNASLIGQIVACKGRVAVVGGVADLMKLVEGAAALQRAERAIGCPDLADFRTWKEVVDYAESDAGRDLAVLVRLVSEYGTDGLMQLLRRVDGNEADEERCDVILTSAHKSKGREWNHVLLLDDFPVPNDADLGLDSEEEPTKWNSEEANLLYVAVTRAKQVLDISACDAWLDALERCQNAGVHLPGLTDNPEFMSAEQTAKAPDRTAEMDEAEYMLALLVRASAEAVHQDRNGQALLDVVRQHAQSLLLERGFDEEAIAIAIQQRSGQECAA